MKRLKLLIFATALMAVGTLATSCMSVDDPVVPSQVSKVNGAKYSIVATSNVDVIFSIDVAGAADQINVKKANFKNLTAKNVKVTAKYTGANFADYVNATQTVDVNFSKGTTAVVNFAFVKKSTTTVSQSEVAANGATLVNDDKAVAAVAMELEPGTTVTNGVTGPFRLSAFKSPSTLSEDEDLSLNRGVKKTLFSMDCQPDGAQFSKNVGLTVDFGTLLAGKTVELLNGDEKVTATVGADGKATFKVGHFSEWRVEFMAYVKSVEDVTETIATVNVDAVAGTNTFSYKKNVGVEHTLTGALGDYANSVLGSYGVGLSDKVEETASFEATGAGAAKVTVTQKKTVYTFDYEGITFSATLWGDVSYNVEISSESKGGHSGGSGK